MKIIFNLSTYHSDCTKPKFYVKPMPLLCLNVMDFFIFKVYKFFYNYLFLILLFYIIMTFYII